MKYARRIAEDVAEAYAADILTGQAPGLCLTDMGFGLHGPAGTTTVAWCLSGAYTTNGKMTGRCRYSHTIRRREDGGIEVVYE